MKGKLYRWNWGMDCTQSVMVFGGLTLHTIEKPYVRAEGHPGGEPFRSCVEPGKYDLVPFVRPDGSSVYQLLNPELGVYEFESDMPAEGGRYLILIHTGNWAKDVVGCIAPGLTEDVDNSGNPMVASSALAMKKLMGLLNQGDNHTLEIVP
jgi:hypothetical protein